VARGVSGGDGGGGLWRGKAGAGPWHGGRCASQPGAGARSLEHSNAGLVAGLLTGLGTKIGNGCTSGHGVCGIARLSRRSFVAVAVFFGVAMLTVAITGVV
jgi:uncharacterized membrane protein YedE/YeeE